MRPLSKDLQEFIRFLNREKVEYLVVGAWALAFHGRPRYTGDVDIFLRRDEANAQRMMRVIEAFGFASTGLAREDFLREDFVIQSFNATTIFGVSGESQARQSASSLMIPCM